MFKKTLEKIRRWFCQTHKTETHKFRHWYWADMDGVPTIRGGSTGFTVAFCSEGDCNCVAVIPRANLMEFADPKFREEFLEGLKNRGQKLVD